MFLVQYDPSFMSLNNRKVLHLTSHLYLMFTFCFIGSTRPTWTPRNLPELHSDSTESKTDWYLHSSETLSICVYIIAAPLFCRLLVVQVLRNYSFLMQDAIKPVSSGGSKWRMWRKWAANLMSDVYSQPMREASQNSWRRCQTAVNNLALEVNVNEHTTGDRNVKCPLQFLLNRKPVLTLCESSFVVLEPENWSHFPAAAQSSCLFKIYWYWTSRLPKLYQIQYCSSLSVKSIGWRKARSKHACSLGVECLDSYIDACSFLNRTSYNDVWVENSELHTTLHTIAFSSLSSMLLEQVG